MTFLLDTNVLIALAWPQHVHHAVAHAWFSARGRASWATCPLTQLGFIRISANPKIIADAVIPRAAVGLLRDIVALPGHEFWADELVPVELGLLASIALVGHRQVADAYLLALCESRGGALATLDRGVAELARGEGEEGSVELIA